MTLGIGLVGTGAIASLHAQHLADAGCVLACVMGVDPDEVSAFAETFGFRRTTGSLDDLLGDSDVDAVVIASPSAEHSRQARRALEHGKHVLCEIPLALSTDEAERVLAAWQRRPDLVCMVAHTRRLTPDLIELVDRVRSETFHPLSYHHSLAMMRRENVGWTGRRRTWTDDIVWHHGMHALDTALFVTGGRPERIVALAGAGTDVDLPMDVAISLTTSTGCLINLALSYNSHQPRDSILVVGSEETWQFEGLRRTDGTSPASDHMKPERAAELLSLAMTRQVDLFVQNILSGRTDGPTISGVVDSYRWMGAVHADLNGPRADRQISDA